MTFVKPVTPADVIRSDRRGRLLVRAEQRTLILEAFDASSMSAMAFCRQYALSYSTFATWIQKRRKEAVIPPSPAACGTTVDKPIFSEVLVRESVAAPAPCPTLKVKLVCGVSYEISDPTQMPLAIQLVQALAAPRPC